MYRWEGALLLGLALAGGCADKGDEPSSLKPQSFQNGQTRLVEQGGVTAAPPRAIAQDNGQAAEPVKTPVPQTQPPQTPSATRPASSGTFMYVGAKLGEVNGQPIYAHRILAAAWDAELFRKAGDPAKFGPVEFRQAAANAINSQIQSEIQNELAFASAQRNLNEEEQQRARNLTMAWRTREINAAGGSLAVASRLSLEKDGIDFEERAREQFKQYMVLIYQVTRVAPRVRVTGDDMRRYYDQNTAQFTEKAGVKFRIIKVGVRENENDRAKALDRMKDIWEKASRGDDFVNLAMNFYNDDKPRAKVGGWWRTVDVKKDDGTIEKEPAWLPPGSLAGKLEELEKAVFALEPQQITGIIDVGDAFYIAKLEEKQTGRVRAFEAMEVQEEIGRILRAQQHQVLQQKESAKRIRSASISIDDAMLKATIDMAMQKYAQQNRNPAAVGSTAP